MRRTRPQAVIGGLLLSVSLLAASCGGSSSSSASSTTAAGGSTGTSGSSSNNGDSTATPKVGGTLTMALEAETSGGFCIPEAQFAASGQEVMNAIYDPLVALGSDFKPKPYLAESVTPNATYDVYTIKLRSGVKFHDGTDLTAQVVADNMNVWIGNKAEVAKSGRHPLLFPITYSAIKQVDVTDPLTVTVTMNKPWIAFEDYLASGRDGIMGESQLNGSADDCASKLNGTGPFKLVSWDRNNQMVLEKNPSYWMKDAKGVQLPYLDKLIFKPIDGNINRFNALAGGTVDMADLNGQDTFDQVTAAPAKYSWATDTKGHREVGYGMANMGRAPFSDKATRFAIGEGIDRTRLNQIANEGKYQIANGPFDTDVLGFVKDATLPKYDPTAAKAALAGKNISFHLSYATDPSTKRLADEIQRELGQIGVTVQVDEKDQSTLINQALSGNFDILLWRNHPGLDPDTQYLWFHSGFPTNFGKINDPVIDKALEDGRSNTDPAARKADYETVYKQFIAGGYDLWNYNTEWMYGANKKVHNFSNYILPDGSKGAGLNWGWSYLTGVWVG